LLVLSAFDIVHTDPSDPFDLGLGFNIAIIDNDRSRRGGDMLLSSAGASAATSFDGMPPSDDAHLRLFPFDSLFGSLNNHGGETGRIEEQQLRNLLLEVSNKYRLQDGNSGDSTILNADKLAQGSGASGSAARRSRSKKRRQTAQERAAVSKESTPSMEREAQYLAGGGRVVSEKFGTSGYDVRDATGARAESSSFGDEVFSFTGFVFTCCCILLSFLYFHNIVLVGFQWIAHCVSASRFRSLSNRS
jgi:hypothetical protein